MKSRIPAFAAALFVLSLSSHHAGAAITVSNLVITATSVRFDISGTLPSPAPAGGQGDLYFVNPDKSASPGFAFGDAGGGSLVAATISFTGSQSFRNGIPVGTGVVSYGDYFYVAFDDSASEILEIGDEISGTFTATWSGTAFDPSQVSSLDVFWGYGSDPQPDSGTYLTSAPVIVPEVSSISLLAGAGVLLSLRRRRK